MIYRKTNSKLLSILQFIGLDVDLDFDLDPGLDLKLEYWHPKSDFWHAGVKENYFVYMYRNKQMKFKSVKKHWVYARKLNPLTRWQAGENAAFLYNTLIYTQILRT